MHCDPKTSIRLSKCQSINEIVFVKRDGKLRNIVCINDFRYPLVLIVDDSTNILQCSCIVFGKQELECHICTMHITIFLPFRPKHGSERFRCCLENKRCEWTQNRSCPNPRTKIVLSSLSLGFAISNIWGARFGRIDVVDEVRVERLIVAISTVYT